MSLLQSICLANRTERGNSRSPDPWWKGGKWSPQWLTSTGFQSERWSRFNGRRSDLARQWSHFNSLQRIEAKRSSFGITEWTLSEQQTSPSFLSRIACSPATRSNTQRIACWSRPCLRLLIALLFKIHLIRELPNLCLHLQEHDHEWTCQIPAKAILHGWRSMRDITLLSDLNNPSWIRWGCCYTAQCFLIKWGWWTSKKPGHRIKRLQQNNRLRMQCAQTAHLMMNSTNTTPRAAEAKISQ